MTIRWAPLHIADDTGSFLFSPRSGRTYLVDSDVASGRWLPRLLGLKPENMAAELRDPAIGVWPATTTAPAVHGWFLPYVYVFVHHHRRIATISRVLRIARLVAFLRVPRARTLTEISQCVRAVEERAGVSDCYPRALITAHLCLRAGRDCSIAFGILAPTRMLHAWCVAERFVPYEPEARHWWYRPLAVLDVTCRVESRSR